MANEKRLIDANALIKDIDNYYHNSPFPHPGTTWLRGLELAVGLMLKAPTVDAVEVVHGRWLFDSNTERYFCSACNEQALYTSRDVPEYDYDWEENLRYSHTETYIEEHLTDYCPNCGAKMDGDGNG